MRFHDLRKIFILLLSLVVFFGCKKEEDQIEKSKLDFALTITSHKNAQYVNTKSIDIVGSFSVEESVALEETQIKLKDTAAEITSAGVFKVLNHELKIGKNKIDLKLLVNDEVKAKASIWIIYSDYYIEILSPFDGEVFRSGEADINGVYQYPDGIDPSELKIKIDSHLEANINADGTFSYEGYKLKKGTHKLTAKLYLDKKEKFRDINEVKFYEKNKNPKSKIFIDPMEGKSPMTVTIDGSDSSDVDGTISRYIWDLGDGTQLETTDPTFTHTYKWILRGCDGETREHAITLQVIDNDGGVSKTHKKVITLECEPNSPPVVGADQNIDGVEDTVLNFSLNPASDVDGDPITYHIVSAPSVGTLNGCLDGTNSTSCEYIPMPNYFGAVTFTYKVNDGIYDSESFATVTLNLAPVNDIPEMKGDQNFEFNEDEVFEFNLLGAGDIDGDTLTYRVVDAPLNAQLQDCISNNGDLSCKIIPNKDYYGPLEFTYIANDSQVDAYNVSKVTFNVKPVNDAPVMVSNQSFSLNEDESISIILSGATDVENNPLTYTLVSSPTNGVIKNCLNSTSDLVCDFVPNKDFNGQVNFSYKANDGLLDSQSVSVITLSIAPVNDIPIIGASQSVEMEEDNQISFTLNNATDVDGDILKYKIVTPVTNGTLSGCGNDTTSLNCTFTPNENYYGDVFFTYVVNDGSVNSVSVARVDIKVKSVNDIPVVGENQTLATSEDSEISFTLNSGSDIENSPLTYIIVNAPVNGVIEGCGNNSGSRNCIFKPSKDFYGKAGFTYKVNDGDADSATTAEVVINIAPVNDAPVIGEEQSIDSNEDEVLNFAISSATDVDNETLNYHIVDLPNSGTLNNCLDGTPTLNCEFIPEENFFGKVEFTYKVNDGELDSEITKVTLNILPVNDLPQMPIAQTFEVNEDNTLNFTLLPAADIENDELVYSIVDLPNNGVVSECLESTNDLECKITSTENFFGDITFSYKANDGKGDSETVTNVTIKVLPVNDPPLMGADQSFTINENTSFSFDVNSASDVENDTLSYKVILPPNKGTLSDCMDDNNDLTCNYTPPENFYGDVVIRYRAHDGTDSTEKLGTINIKVLMVNVAPVMADNTSFEVNEDEQLEFTIPSATDADGDDLTYSIVKSPASGSLAECIENNSDLTCKYNPPENFSGLVTFTYMANDGRLNADTITEITINVKEVNDRPFIGESQMFALDENSSVKFTLSEGRDLENNPLTYSVVSGPANGQIIGCLDSTDSLICEYKPNLDFKGQDSLTYKVNDGENDSEKFATLSFTVNEINRAPIFASKTSSFETNEDIELNLTLESSSDANGDPVSYWIQGEPENGKLEDCLKGTTDLTCKFIPDQDFNGDVVFSYISFDGALYSERHQINIKVNPVNDPPRLGANQEIIFNEDEKVVFTLNKAIDVDTDDSLIFYSIISPPSNGVLQNCFNFTNDIECEFIPDENFSGEIEFTYTASDGENFAIEVGKVLLNIKNINDVPYFEKAQLAELSGDQTSELSIAAAIDSDGDNLTYEIVDLPSTVTLENCLNGTGDLICDFTPEIGLKGDISFTLRAFDGAAYSEPQTVTVSVMAPPVYAIQIDSNEYATCSVMNNGELYCWGYGGYGQLGYGHYQNIGDDEVPASVGKVSVGSKVKKVSRGWFHTCVITDSDDLKCWGRNYEGQLGQGNTIRIGDDELPSSIPVISLGEKVKDVETGAYHTCAILESGNVKCWGRNSFGTLGLARADNIGDNEKPVDIPNVNIGASVKQLAAGLEHTCALLESGDVKCWGNNGRTYRSCYTTCRNNADNSNKWHSGGGCSTVTVCNDYTNLWGSLGLGRLAVIGDDEHPSSVENVDIGGKAISISATERGTCAVLENNQLRCWGRHYNGELGYGSSSTYIIGDDEKPTAIDPIDVGFAVKSVDAGRRHSCALSTSNESKCWGYNGYGALGQGNTIQIGYTNPPSSVDSIPFEKSVKQITAGFYFTCVLLEDNNTKCFGYNGHGQLGQGHRDYLGNDEPVSSIGEVNLNGSFPVANIEVADESLQAPVNIVFNAMASTPSEVTGSIVKYEWNFGDGNVAEGAVANNTFTRGGNFQVRLIITDDQGLTAVARRNIYVAPEPMPISRIGASRFSGNASLEIDFDGSTSTASEIGETISSYLWDFGNGQTSNEISPKVVFTGAGVYTVKLTVVDSKNREHTSYRTISVFDSLPPVANYTFDSGELRAPIVVNFDGSSSTPGSFDGSVNIYEWSFSSLGTTTGQVTSFEFTEGGIYPVTLKVTDNRGKVGNKVVNVEILPELKPVSVIASSIVSGYRPLSINFDGISSTPTNPTGNIASYNWKFGDGNTGQGSTVSHVFNDQGVFTVELEVIDDVGKKSISTVEIEVLPKSPPIAEFSITNETLLPHVPFDITLDASASDPGAGGGSIDNYSWDFGNGVVKTGQVVSHRFETPGSYEISLTVTNSDGEISTKKIVKEFHESLLVNIEASYNVLFIDSWTKFNSFVKDHELNDVNSLVTWESSDNSVLAIRTDGWAQAKSEGVAYVTAKIANNISQQYKVVVKDKTSVPMLLVQDDYFASSYEETMRGGVFGLNSGSYITADYTPFSKYSVYNSNYFYPGFSLVPGISSINIKAYDNGSYVSQNNYDIRYFDGHGKSLLFDGVDDKTTLEIGEEATNSSTFSISLWTRLSDVSLAGRILELSDSRGKGIKLDFDYRKMPILSIDNEKSNTLVIGNSIKSNTWVHLSFNIDTDNKSLEMYQNGKLVSSNTIHWPLGWTKQKIIGSLGAASFKGLIDEFKVYDTLLTRSDINSLMFENSIVDKNAVIDFNFEGEEQQAYYSGLASKVILGIGTGFDVEDPSLRFSSEIIGKKVFTPNEGGLLSFEKILDELNPLFKMSFEIAPFTLESDMEVSLEMLDARTYGFLPKGIVNKEYLLRIHPLSTSRLSNPATLTLPIQSELYKNSGSVNLLQYKKSSGALYLKKPINVNVNEQIATFPIQGFGTFFTTYDLSFYPNIVYDGNNFSDGAFNFSYDRRIDAKFIKAGTGPFDITVTGNTDGAFLYYASCESGSVEHNNDFPLTFKGMPLGSNYCYLYYKKKVDDMNNLYIYHLLRFDIEN